MADARELQTEMADGAKDSANPITECTIREESKTQSDEIFNELAVQGLVVHAVVIWAC